MKVERHDRGLADDMKLSTGFVLLQYENKRHSFELVLYLNDGRFLITFFQDNVRMRYANEDLKYFRHEKRCDPTSLASRENGYIYSVKKEKEHER